MEGGKRSVMKKAIVGTTLLSAALVNGFTFNGQSGFHFKPIQSRSIASCNLPFQHRVDYRLPSTLVESVSEGVDAASEGEVPEAVPASDIPQLSIEDVVVGEEYTGTVKNIVTFGAFVDIGVGVNGLVHVSQISDTFVRQAAEVVTEGQEVKVKVLEVDTENGKLVLSMRKNPRDASQQRGDVSKYTAIDKETFIEGKVEDIVPYGAFIRVDEEVVGFCHISQLKKERVENVEDVLTKGQDVKVRIIEVDEEKRRLSLTLMTVEEASKTGTKNKRVQDVSVLSKYDPNEFVDAKVVSLKDYGVFVEVDGVQGLVHISKIRENRVDVAELQEMFKVGATTQVRVLEVDTEANKVYFSAQGTAANYVDFDPEEYKTYKITSISDFGVFADIGKFEALLHRSEIPEYVEDLNEKFNIGDEITARIMKVDPESNQVRLSMRDPARGKPSNKDVSQFADFDPEAFIPGKVVLITSYGAFVNVADNVDGMCHISQLSEDNNVASVEDVLTVGQEIQVRIISCDVENAKLELSMLPPPPKRKENGDVSAFADSKPEEFIPGTVSGIIRSGAFITLSEEVDGFCHISQIGQRRVNNINDELKIGQEVKVRVQSVDVENKKVDLSMRPYRATKPGSFEDDMSIDEASNEVDWKNFLTNTDEFNTSLS
mmetsp:Transcript_19878/g.26214  ORF Transcript_19878/g.26214 Transcript_19878/m.26214 type:complete len:658 (-) Transcript_19878:399-2372(-)